jgi:tetratricopeptide (TPR) repeat protein
MPEPRVRFAEKVLELSLAVVLLAVPLFVVPYSALPFEEAKVALLRTLVLFCLPFFAIILFRKKHDSNSMDGPGIKHALLFTALVLFFGYIHGMSAFFSVSPMDSISGTQLRRQGAATTWCYLCFFFIVIATIRTQRQIDRVLLAVLLAGFVVSFWALLQYLGLDPNLKDGFEKPTWSTFGNRLFLPAFLILCIPINIYFLCRSLIACRRCNNTFAPARTRVRLQILFLICLLFLALNTFAIAMAQKRGPLLGLAVGLFLCLVLYFLGNGRRKIAVSLLGGGGLLASLLVYIGLAGHRFVILSHIPLVNTLADSFHSGTGLVRYYIWKGAINLLLSNPLRAIFGYGGETLPYVLPAHSFSILKQIERPTAIADRAHNEILDLMVMQGFFGTIAFLLIFGMLGYVAFFQMGLIHSRRHKIAWTSCLCSGSILGGLIPYALSGHTTLSAMGIGLGLVGGFFIYLLWYSVTLSKGHGVDWNAQKLLSSLLLSSLVAHFIEIQFSFGITATRLYYWVLAGMVVGVGFFSSNTATMGADSEQKSRFELPTPIFPAILAGVTIITISFNYLCFGRYHDNFYYSVVACNVCTLLFCWFFARPDRVHEAGLKRPLREKNIAYFMVVLGLGLLYYLAYFILEHAVALMLHLIFKNSILTVLEKSVKLISFYGWVLAIIVSGSIFIRSRGGPHIRLPGKKHTALLYLFMVLLMLPPVVRFNLNYSMADIYTKAGDEWAQSGDWEIAGRCFRYAVTLEPEQAWRHQKLGHLFFMRAKKESEPQKSRLYHEAILRVDKATQLAPLDVTLKNNLARMSSAWAAQADTEKNRFHRLKLTEAFYERALTADPSNTFIWKEAGQISAALGHIEKALKQFNHALKQHPNDFESHHNLALLYQASNQYVSALDHARTAFMLATDPDDRQEIEELISKLKKEIQ